MDRRGARWAELDRRRRLHGGDQLAGPAPAPVGDGTLGRSTVHVERSAAAAQRAHPAVVGAGLPRSERAGRRRPGRPDAAGSPTGPHHPARRAARVDDSGPWSRSAHRLGVRGGIRAGGPPGPVGHLRHPAAGGPARRRGVAAGQPRRAVQRRRGHPVRLVVAGDRRHRDAPAPTRRPGPARRHSGGSDPGRASASRGQLPDGGRQHLACSGDQHRCGIRELAPRAGRPADPGRANLAGAAPARRHPGALVRTRPGVAGRLGRRGPARRVVRWIGGMAPPALASGTTAARSSGCSGPMAPARRPPCGWSWG